ncbi:MAG: DUF6391 domain-containing protein [Anaerolineae bacterium]|jgi:hypothetical protein
MNLLNLSLIVRLRRNHALEHATMHVLAERGHSRGIVGRSTFGGYYLYGNLDTEMVSEAAQEALARLRAGKRHLAIHPNCGTNLVTAGSMAGLATFAVLSGGKKRRLDLLPNALLAAITALFLAQPMGPLIQARVTTLSDVGGLTIKGVRCEKRRSVVVHFIETG